jgi:hypothetical protein
VGRSGLKPPEAPTMSAQFSQLIDHLRHDIGEVKDRLDPDGLAPRFERFKTVA